MTAEAKAGAPTNAIARKIDALQRKGAMRSVDIANLLGAGAWPAGRIAPRRRAVLGDLSIA